MAILSFDTNVMGQTGESPAISYFSTDNTVAQVIAPGYLNAFIAGNPAVAVADMCLIRTRETPSSDQAVAWYSVTFTAPNYILLPANSPFPVVTVPFGGTGLSSLVPDAVMLGGVTSTSPMQQVSGLGLAGEVLTSAGAGLPPVWGSAGGSGAPASATYITQTPNGTLTNEQALSLLATGILKSTTATGVVSIAVDGSDYFGPLSTIPIANGGTSATTASGARTALGLAIGTNVEAWDAGLDSIAALTTSAGTMLYTTASDTYATTSSTSFGRSLLNLANAAAGQTAFGLGTIATQDANNVNITGGSIILSTPLGVASGGTGDSSFTTYALIAGGTTSTGALQQVSGLGTAGQVLTSAGAGALPVWSAASSGGTVTSVSGTANRITVTSPTTTPVIDISTSYVGQATITTLGTITTGTWSATNIALNKGGSNAALTAVNGGIVYSTASAMAISAAGSAGQVLLSGGAGAPTWSTPTFPATVGPVGTILRSDGTNYVATTATYPNSTTANRILYSSSTSVIGQITSANNSVLVTDGSGVPSLASTLPSAVQLNITSLGVVTAGTWNAGIIPLAYGGTNAALSANVGGIFYSTATAGAILAGTATAGQMLRSGASAAPTWSTATFPATATGTGTLLRADGTNWVASTSTYPNTNVINSMLYASSANVMSALTTVNSSVLTTTSGGVPTWIALTDGQIVIGSTAGSPAAATISAGSGITVTNASNSITITAINSGTVTSVSGTANRITSTGGATPVIDISAAYVGQSSITTVGTISSGSWGASATTIAVGSGGTGDTSFTAYSVICGGTTSGGALQNVSGLGTSGQVLTSAGAGALPTWTTAGTGTVTSVSGTTNRITVATGTTTPVIDISAAYVGQSSITTLGTISTGVWQGTAVTVSNGGTGVTTMTTAYAPVLAGTTATGALQVASTGLSTAGFVLTSNGSSAAPSFQAATTGALTWSTVTTSTSMSTLHGYVANGGSLITFTLPATAAVGETMQILGLGAGGWTIVENSGQSMNFSPSTTAVTTGSLSSTNRYDSVTLICSVANTAWNVFSQGSLTIV